MGISGGYRYYPETNSYTDGSGKTVIPPRSISSGISEGVKARVSPKKKVTLTKEPTVRETSKKKYTRKKFRAHRVHRMHRR